MRQSLGQISSEGFLGKKVQQMVQVLQGKDVTLAQLIDEFGLQLAEDEDFFQSGSMIYLS